MVNYAFYGQAIIKTGRRGARLIHDQQLAEATSRVQQYCDQIVADYFDVYPDRLWSCRHRRQAHHLLRAIEDPRRSFDAIVISDTGTALTARQYDELLELCTQHRVELWLAEIDAPVDRDNDEHQAILAEKLWGVSPALRETIMRASVDDSAALPIGLDRDITKQSPIPAQRRPPSRIESSATGGGESPYRRHTEHPEPTQEESVR
jgi:lambda repressor-like predicted transcriptional regulator